MPLSVGQIIDGKYRIVRPLAEGGMGAVFEAEEIIGGRHVAIKALLPELARQEDIVERFEREVRVAQLVKSPYLVEFLDFGALPTGERFMVMEYLDGESLQTRLELYGPMPIKEVLRFSFGLLDGLAKVHDAGIVHRDINPHNIYFAKRPSGEIVKIIDFGLAKVESEHAATSKRLTLPGSVLGTPHFMAPEQARGLMHEVDARSDLYAVGVVLYRAITGHLPFRSPSYVELAIKINSETPPSPLDLVPGLDAGFVAIIQKAMAKEKAKRFGSARELLGAIAHWAGIPVITDVALDTTAPSAVMMAAPKVGQDK
jgi:serine/threonine-protein kinase